MDTWATSSLTPQIAGGWLDDPDLFARVFPMDVRPQAHDIIRTWLFSTVLRSHLEFGTLPWAHAAISGWVLDPDRKKMSKSKGNVVTPMGLLEEHGADGVRYWAASARPGTDTAFDPAQMKVGRRLAIKLLNAAKFVLGRSEPRGAISHPLDVGILTNLASLVRDATERLENEYDYAWVLQHTESFFWDFCDNYLELVKSRRYGDFGEAAAGSANATMLVVLGVLQRLLAPYLPFVSDEIWSWWQPGSVHAAPWPTEAEVLEPIGDRNADAYGLYLRTTEVLAAIRKKKSERTLSAGAQLDRVVIRHNENLEQRLSPVLSDLRAAVRADALEFMDDTMFDVEITPKLQERGA
jgi:valyl-tRNA synthetase